MTENSTKLQSWFEGKWFNFRYKTDRYLPLALRSQHYHEMLEGWRRYDQKKNVNSTPPQNERIDLRCVWAVEFYAPAHVDSLMKNLEKLGWDQSGSPLGDDKGIAAWVRKIRERQYGGAWLNLGYITDRHDKRHYSRTQRAVLPPNIGHATGNMFSMTPSLICIVVGFVFEEKISEQFEKALRQDRQTSPVPIERGYRILDPSSAKAEDIDRKRNAIKNLAFDWFKQNLPGIFCSGLLDTEIPICEYTQLKTKKPFPPWANFDWEADGYLAPLQFAPDSDAYEQQDHPFLRFSWSSRENSRNDFYSLLAGCEADFDDEEIKPWGREDRSGQIAYVDDFMKGTIGLWALIPLLQGYSRQQSGLRDSALLRAKTKKKALNVLSELEKHVSYGVDIASVTTELVEFSSRRGLFFHEAKDFRPKHPVKDRKADDSLAERIRAQVNDAAMSLNNSENALRSIVTQYGTMLGTKENIALQRQIRGLTLLIIALTIIALWPILEDQGIIQMLASLANSLFTIGSSLREWIAGLVAIF